MFSRVSFWEALTKKNFENILFDLMILTKNNVPVIQYIDVPQSAVTFNGLSSGSYTLQVRDADNCSVYKSFSISVSNSLDFGMSSTSCGDTNSGGTINVSIFSLHSRPA